MYVSGRVRCDSGNTHIWTGMTSRTPRKGLNIACCIVKISIRKNGRTRRQQDIITAFACYIVE